MWKLSKNWANWGIWWKIWPKLIWNIVLNFTLPHCTQKIYTHANLTVNLFTPYLYIATAAEKQDVNQFLRSSSPPSWLTRKHDRWQMTDTVLVCTLWQYQHPRALFPPSTRKNVNKTFWHVGQPMKCTREMEYTKHHT